MKLLFQAIVFCGASGILFAGLLPAAPPRQDQGKPAQVAIDPKTGRAVGAKEISPEDLQKLIAQKPKMIIIDVRDESQYQQETIKGAIHIPFEDLAARLKEFPKDTILVFT